MEGTTSPASRSPSPASSETSAKPTASREMEQSAAGEKSTETGRRSELVQGNLRCEWDECGERFGDVHGLVNHLENGHIGVHKSSYTCEWATCPRRGLVQTSRFALVSHCRSHTGEKPFVCSVAECDKSFTRSDTLAKHLRQQHNIATPAPTRGGYRKRKRSMTPPPLLPRPSVSDRHGSHSPPPHPHPQQHPHPHPHPHETFAPSHYNFANRSYAQSANLRDSGFNTFRVNPAIHDRPAPSVSSTIKLRSEAAGVADRPLLPREGVALPEQKEEDAASVSSGEEDGGKPYNAEAMGGRSKAMVKYLIMKAKYQYVLDEKSVLNDELEALKLQEKEEWREKEASVDRILRGFGPQSEQLIHHDLDMAANGKRGRAPVSPSPRDGTPTNGGGLPPPPPPLPHHARHDHRMEVDAR